MPLLIALVKSFPAEKNRQMVIQSLLMKKDTRLTFRVRADLKRKIEAIASREGRSVAQLCDIFLEGGVEQYRKQGSKFILNHFIKKDPTRAKQEGD